jgi:hypothetical protein
LNSLCSTNEYKYKLSNQLLFSPSSVYSLAPRPSLQDARLPCHPNPFRYLRFGCSPHQSLAVCTGERLSRYGLILRPVLILSDSPCSLRHALPVKLQSWQLFLRRPYLFMPRPYVLGYFFSMSLRPLHELGRHCPGCGSVQSRLSFCRK